MGDLTGKQQETLNVILRLQKQGGKFPNLRELAKELGLKSHISVYDRLWSLINKGLVRYQPQSGRQTSPFSIASLPLAPLSWVAPTANGGESQVVGQEQLSEVYASQACNTAQANNNNTEGFSWNQAKNTTSSQISSHETVVSFQADNAGVRFGMTSADPVLIVVVSTSAIFAVISTAIVRWKINPLTLLSICAAGSILILISYLYKVL